MSIANDIKGHIAKEGLNITKVTEMLNQKNDTKYTVQNLHKKINNESLRYSDALEIAEVLGYRIEWVKKD